jgi:hypothetical protein
MDRLFLLIAVIVALGLCFVILPVVVNRYRYYRNRKTVICPDTGQIAEVELKTLRASLMSAIGKRWVRVKWCSLWPRRKNCAQECVNEYWSSSSERQNIRADGTERRGTDSSTIGD